MGWRGSVVCDVVPGDGVVAGRGFGEKGSEACASGSLGSADGPTCLPEVVGDHDGSGQRIGDGYRDVVHEPSGAAGGCEREELVFPNNIHDLTSVGGEVHLNFFPVNAGVAAEFRHRGGVANIVGQDQDLAAFLDVIRSLFGEIVIVPEVECYHVPVGQVDGWADQESVGFVQEAAFEVAAPGVGRGIGAGGQFVIGDAEGPAGLAAVAVVGGPIGGAVEVIRPGGGEGLEGADLVKSAAVGVA